MAPMEARYQELLDEIRKEFPSFRIVKKTDSALQRMIHGALVVLTFGAQRSYLGSYQTTIGRTVYVTAGWDEKPAAERYVTMRHERMHLRQFQRYSLVGMALLYLLVPLPLGLAWFRAHFEKEGYAESIRAAAEIHGRGHVEDPRYRAAIVTQFTSGAYGWMWPFRRGLERWYDDIVRTIP
jgi:hypothetical protein